MELAERIGLVNDIVASDALLARACVTAAKLATKPPEAIRATKALLKRGMDDAVTTAMARELDLFNDRMATPEVSDAIAAFFIRKPD